MMRKIILASNSPRRKELLSGLDIDFVVDSETSFIESYPSGIPHKRIPALMSEGKSHGFHRHLEADEVLITSDTMVFLDDVMMGKPHSRQEAVDMLQALSGKTHEVITAVTIRDVEHEVTFQDSTLVTFAEMEKEDIDYYIDNYKPYDKAGAYGIQEWIGYALITGIEGSFFNVMGFPVHKVRKELKKFI